jgi:hypothetical protein
MSNILLNHQLTILENILLRPGLEITRAVAKNFMVSFEVKLLVWAFPFFYFMFLGFGDTTRMPMGKHSALMIISSSSLDTSLQRKGTPIPRVLLQRKAGM